MAAAAMQFYYSAKLRAVRQGVESLPIYCTLHTAAYAPDLDHELWSSASPSQLAGGNGYPAGGRLLENVQWEQAGAAAIFRASPVVFPDATLLCKYALLTWRLGGAGNPNDPLLGFIDLVVGGEATVTQGSFSIEWAGGLFSAT